VIKNKVTKFEKKYNRIKDRGNRIYNGLPSQLMNDIYDQLLARDETIINQPWWCTFSLYLARSCGVIERKYFEEK
jgi:hypothetical protein